MIVVETIYIVCCCCCWVNFDINEVCCSMRYDSHELIVSDDLDCHLLAGPGSVPGSDHVAEYTLASVAIHIIAFVQRLTDVHP